MRSTVALFLALLGPSCARVQRVPLLATSVDLPAGRFRGPVEVPVPRHADHQGHRFDIAVRLEARCDPRLTLAFPDGEQRPLGLEDTRWQALLTARAQGEVTAPTTDSPSVTAPAPTPTAPAPGAAPAPPAPSDFVAYPPPQPSATVGVEAGLYLPGTPGGGRYQRTLTERWRGQLEFEAQRQARCAQARTFTAFHRNALDDTGTVAVWADVPQELADARLTVEVVAQVPQASPPPVEVQAQVQVAAAAPTPSPRPPAPAPRVEEPGPPRTAGARWRPGSWRWREGDGQWVWTGGTWSPPEERPAPRVEQPGPPPVSGCRWAGGTWAWVGQEGLWEWVPGHWEAPPPLQEDRGTPPDPTAPWYPGSWLALEGTFRWQPGRWGKPGPRQEVRPPAPFPGAVWISGEWLLVGGRWVWSPGFFEGTERPPPPREEVVPPRPHPEAVWLAGFWRWDVAARTHRWIDGHWELPPAEGYVWVPEPPGPGLLLRGRWELKVRP